MVTVEGTMTVKRGRWWWLVTVRKKHHRFFLSPLSWISAILKYDWGLSSTSLFSLSIVFQTNVNECNTHCRKHEGLRYKECSEWYSVLVCSSLRHCLTWHFGIQMQCLCTWGKLCDLFCCFLFSWRNYEWQVLEKRRQLNEYLWNLRLVSHWKTLQATVRSNAVTYNLSTVKRKTEGEPLVARFPPDDGVCGLSTGWHT